MLATLHSNKTGRLNPLWHLILLQCHTNQQGRYRRSLSLPWRMPNVPLATSTSYTMLPLPSSSSIAVVASFQPFSPLWLPLLQVLSRLPQLRSVSLKGCPLASAPGYREGISALLPRLEILDTQRIAERPRKQLAAAAAAAAAGAAQSDERAPPPKAGTQGVGEGQAALAAKPHREQQVQQPAQQQQPHKKKRAADGAGKSSMDQPQQHTAAPARCMQEAEQPSAMRKLREAAGQQEHALPSEDAAEPHKKKRRRSRHGQQKEAAEGAAQAGELAAGAAPTKQPKQRSQQQDPHQQPGRPSKPLKHGSQDAQPPAFPSDDDDVADAAELLGKPSKQKRDPKQTGPYQDEEAMARRIPVSIGVPLFGASPATPCCIP